MLSCLYFKPYAKTISLYVTLASPLCLDSITNSNRHCHDNLLLWHCLHLSIHTFIQSIFFAMYKCIASQS